MRTSLRAGRLSRSGRRGFFAGTGRWIAYSEGPLPFPGPSVGGGPLSRACRPGEAQIRNNRLGLGESADSRRPASKRQAVGAIYESCPTESRRGFWSNHDPLPARGSAKSGTATTDGEGPPTFKQLAWSRHPGESIGRNRQRPATDRSCWTITLRTAARRRGAADRRPHRLAGRSTAAR